LAPRGLKREHPIRYLIAKAERCRSEQIVNMTLLAVELGSLDPESCTPLLKQALDNTESTLQVLIYLIPELLSKLDTPAKRAGRIRALQELLSALYVCSASKADASCNIIFADWCGYKVENETWEYHTLCTAGTLFLLSQY
jgi:hypothetical protein